MPAKMHLFYLREFYLKNDLANGDMVLGGKKLNLHDVKIPVYLQSSREDHIAPFKSVFKATKLYSGPVRFIVAGSGHIAGVINPPSANKYPVLDQRRGQRLDRRLVGQGRRAPRLLVAGTGTSGSPNCRERRSLRARPATANSRRWKTRPGTYVKVKATN